MNKRAGNADYVQGGCGAACKNNHCKLGGKCLDNYNVYKCDCSLTPYYGYFCHKGMKFCCFSGVQHLFVDYAINVSAVVDLNGRFDCAILLYVYLLCPDLLGSSLDTPIWQIGKC